MDRQINGPEFSDEQTSYMRLEPQVDKKIFHLIGFRLHISKFI